MSQASRRTAGILLIILPTVVYGGVSILRLLINDPAYMDNELRQELWRAGHAHAGVLLILSLVALRYVDEANLSNGWKWWALVYGGLLLVYVWYGFVQVPSAGATSPFIDTVGNVVFGVGALILLLVAWRRLSTNRQAQYVK